MEKVKDFFNRLTSNYKTYVKQYMATNIVIIIATLVFTFANFNAWSKFLTSFVIIAVIAAINFFVAESYFKKKSARIYSYIIGFAIAGIFERFVHYNAFGTSIYRILIGYSIVAFLIGLFKVIKNSGLELSKYCTRAFKNLFGTGVIYGILVVGFILIMTIAISLLTSGKDYEPVMRAQIAIFGLFLVPATLLSITNTEGESSKFIEAVISFVLLPLTSLATIIIYIYMLKILALRQIPQNSIYRIIAGLFVVAFPVWVMTYEYKQKNKFVEVFSKIMPIAFIPLIGLQVYSIGARIGENGITPVRYMGVMFIIFEIIAIVLSIVNKRKYLTNAVLVAAGLMAISTILPVVNMKEISNYNQASRLKNAWRKGESFTSLSSEEKATASSAYRYLLRQENSEKYLPKYLDKEELTEKLIEHYSPYGDEDETYDEKRTTYKRVNYQYPDDEVITVEGYNCIKKFQVYEYDINEENLESVSLYDTFNINLKDYVLGLIEANKNGDESAKEYIVSHRVHRVDDSRDIYITDVNLSYEVDLEGNYDSKEGISIVIKGCFLIK
ncbi:MAG: DUF4153 domain-containing protein [Clostridia bacterium]